MVEEWCGPSGGVNIALCLISLWDPQLAMEETKRNAERGVRAICLSELPTHLKLPSIHTGHWDPLFSFCNDAGVTGCMHIGSSDRLDPVCLGAGRHGWDLHDGWQHSNEKIPEPPSTYYYGRIFGCFTAYHHGLASLDEVGLDNICFETDYPPH
ncbi:MAG TPA: hypothetical protein VMU64_14415 [Acidimicrobiales bacterium]|nr:hypothetical protein [Acidimicrobiales bacterium]